jgi:hypothetical protein
MGPKSVNISTTDDDNVEADEFFTAFLSSNSRIALGPSTAVIIKDNDGKIKWKNPLSNACSVRYQDGCFWYLHESSHHFFLPLSRVMNCMKELTPATNP